MEACPTGWYELDERGLEGSSGEEGAGLYGVDTESANGSRCPSRLRDMSTALREARRKRGYY